MDRFIWNRQCIPFSAKRSSNHNSFNTKQYNSKLYFILQAKEQICKCNMSRQASKHVIIFFIIIVEKNNDSP